MLTFRSGKAARNMPWAALAPASPPGKPGMASWLFRSWAISESSAERSLRAHASSTWRTVCLASDMGWIYLLQIDLKAFDPDDERGPAGIDSQPNPVARFLARTVAGGILGFNPRCSRNDSQASPACLRSELNYARGSFE